MLGGIEETKWARNYIYRVISSRYEMNRYEWKPVMLNFNLKVQGLSLLKMETSVIRILKTHSRL